MLYSSTKNKGIGLTRATWEAFIQNFNICSKLQECGNFYVGELRNTDMEIEQCIKGLNIESIFPLLKSRSRTTQGIVRAVRDHLRSTEYELWCGLSVHGKGAILFQESSTHNRNLFAKEGLSSSQWTSYLKMVGNTAAVRSLQGRSQGSHRCRRCNETNETLGHVLGSCSFGELLRNTRHHRIRSTIADSLRVQAYEVHEEVTALDRRVDIIAFDRKSRRGYVIDPTIRIESHVSQPNEVHEEKQSIYDPVCQNLKEKYHLNFDLQVIGLMIGARGTIPKLFDVLTKPLKLPKSTVAEIAFSAVKGSCHILHNHLYSPSKL
jgi:hypothetical protein